MSEALDWLLSFSDPKRGVGWNPRQRGGLEWNLRRMRALLDLSGAPDRRMRCVLVAGTKGKGSTAAMIARLLSASGVRTGLATKPHLQAYRERVRVNGTAVSEETLEALVAELRGAPETLARHLPAAGPPTTFELTTLLAFSAFAAERCDVAVVEVGLGGRFDATNACDPHVSVITAISRDHTKELGTRLEGIAREKAGIMRPGRVAVLAPQVASVRRVLRDECARAGAMPREVRPLADAAAHAFGLPLAGAHQRANAAAALAACETLAEHGVAYDASATRGALAVLRWPGRFEVVEGEPPVVLDGAHNDGSAEALAATLRREFRGRRVHLVLGLMADKDARAVIRPLLPLARAVEVTAPPGPRALPARDLARLVRGVRTRVHTDVRSALAAARADAERRDVICVTGSLALVGAARDALRLRVVERLWG